MPRLRLPNRRESLTFGFEVAGRLFTGTVGIDPEGKIREIFLGGAKVGSDVALELDDAAVVISVSLQYDVPAAALAKSIARVRTRPPTPEELDTGAPVPSVPAAAIGAALEHVQQIQAELDSAGPDIPSEE